ncbi:MAG: reverse transcriptase domain-containing protein, partial [Pseudonocardiaceae bacterium]
HGGGVRVLGVPTVADRIAQTVVARRLEAKVEPIFHPDSYGYRPGRSQLDAVAVCRKCGLNTAMAPLAMRIMDSTAQPRREHISGWGRIPDRVAASPGQ